MKRILLSLSMIAAVGVVVVAGTGAFLSDTETAVGNTFTAGAIDLEIDNTSYYNGQLNIGSTWQLSDLTGQLFFNFDDLKPDDGGEDTISIHVGTNEAWACMNISLTKNDDMDCTEPESDDDLTCSPTPNDTDTNDGELGGLLEFLFWIDDGDNVFEDHETPWQEGTAETLFDGSRWTLADSNTSIDNIDGGPLNGNETYYIGKAWCFGDLTQNPVTNNAGVDPTVASGVMCDGVNLDNAAQTDSVMVDVMFEAVQARHNPGYLCVSEPGPETGTITVQKIVTNDNGGNNNIPDFALTVDGNPATHNVPVVVSTGAHVVSETGVTGYQATIGGDCNAAGNVTVGAGENKACTITNDDISSSITLIKSVVNDDGGTLTPTNFPLQIDGNPVPNNSSVAVTANSPHTITETQQDGYAFVLITGDPECPVILGGTATLSEGESITCTITNDDKDRQSLGGDFPENFGTGATNNDIFSWDEEGLDSDPTTRAEAAGSGEDSASPDGERFAYIGDNEWICNPVSTAGFSNLLLNYYWRGDTDAEDGDSGFVEHRSSGSCTATTGWTTVATHELDDTNNDADEGWSALQSVGLPNGITLVRFRNGNQDAADEIFRIDGVDLTGIPD